MKRYALPLSVRLALWYALTLGLLLGAFALFCFAGFRASSQRAFDRHLAHELGTIAPLVRWQPDGTLDVAHLNTSAPPATRITGGGATFARVLTAGGDVLWASDNFSGRDGLAVLTSDGAESRAWGGTSVRSLARSLSNALGTRVEVTGYEWTGPGALRGLAGMLAIGVLLGVLVALAAGWWLAQRALRPVAVLTESAASLAEEGARVGGRLPATFAYRDELTDLAGTFNELLGRLEASVARERRFTANAAHELMNPLASLRSDAEVALRRPRTAPEYREVLGRVVEESERMASSVEGLLHLARAEALGRTPDARLDLSALVRQRVDRLGARAQAAGLTLAADVEPGIRLAAQAAPLVQIIDNLVENAIKYTPSGGSVRVALTHRHGGGTCSGTARLIVEDTGIGFGGEADRLFDRFYRSDAPDVQARPGTGLGLAVVKAVAEAYGGRVGCASEGPGAGARFWAELPCVGDG
jgi:signal transduction histidine kinase